MISMMSNELILHIGSYCSIKDINSLSQICKVVADRKLYRLCISHIICYRLIGEYSYTEFKNQFKFFNPYDSLTYQYKLNDYIIDLFELLFKNECISNISDKYYYRKYKYSLKYKHSVNLLYILKDNYRMTKYNITYENEIRDFPRCHHVYRVCPVAYTRLRKNHLNVLALIY